MAHGERADVQTRQHELKWIAQLLAVKKPWLTRKFVMRGSFTDWSLPVRLDWSAAAYEGYQLAAWAVFGENNPG